MGGLGGQCDQLVRLGREGEWTDDDFDETGKNSADVFYNAELMLLQLMHAYIHSHSTRIGILRILKIIQL